MLNKPDNTFISSMMLAKTRLANVAIAVLTPPDDEPPEEFEEDPPDELPELEPPPYGVKTTSGLTMLRADPCLRMSSHLVLELSDPDILLS